jgi:hypothetical protein
MPDLLAGLTPQFGILNPVEGYSDLNAFTLPNTHSVREAPEDGAYRLELTGKSMSRQRRPSGGGGTAGRKKVSKVNNLV